jgi:Putative Actinobacterial Holin-X, holin superfamily III
MTEQQAAIPVDGAAGSPERTLGQLVADATRDLSEIVRAELALAKAELREDVKNGAMAGGMFGAAGYLGLLASITAVITVGYALTETGLPAWAAFLIVTVGLLLIAGLLVLIGRSRIRRVGPPERAIRTTRETLAAVRPNSAGR